MAREKTLYEPVTIWRVLFWVLAVPAAVVVLVFFWRAVAVWRTGYDWNQMDWNGDGHTTVAEFFQTTDVGVRVLQVANQSCVEYFDLKHHRRIRLSCPEPK